MVKSRPTSKDAGRSWLKLSAEKGKKRLHRSFKIRTFFMKRCMGEARNPKATGHGARFFWQHEKRRENLSMAGKT